MQILISRPDLARRWGKSLRSLDRYQRSNQPGFPTPIDLNGRWHFRVADVERYEHSLAGIDTWEAA